MLPNLIHPIWIEIEPINKAGTLYDTDAREPIRETAKKADVRVVAQVSNRVPGRQVVERLGVTEKLDGYLLFRVVDLDALSYVPRRGDFVKAIGHRTRELWLIAGEDRGHYPDQAGASLLRFYFGSRRPSAKTPDFG